MIKVFYIVICSYFFVFCVQYLNCIDHFKQNDGVIVVEMDYSERYQPVPMREIQSENFAKDVDVSMEIRIVSFQDTNMSRQTLSYSHLSDEKPQIAATTFQNTIQMLNDLKERGNLSDDYFNMMVFITDGCSGQYKCGTALYLLTMLAQRTGKLMHHFVKCAGHGKCRCNAEGGCHKTFCDTAFDNFVTLPEQQVDGKHWAPSHKVESGSIVSLARIVCNILHDDDYVRGARSHSSRKKKEAGRLITERRFIVRERGDTEFLPLKMEAMGFGTGKNMGIRTHHNFVADPEIVGYSVMARRVPCLCHGCLQRFQKPIGERYSNPCNDCKYWTMYLGWNDWRKINFRKKKDCDVDEHERAQQWTLNQIGERMAELIEISQYGAYLVDDRMKYYLVQWTLDPWKVEGGSLETDGGVAREGEWVCKGLWLNDVDRAPCWFWLSDKEVVVRCQFVLCSNVVLQNHDTDNDLPRMNTQYRQSILQLNPMRLSDETHDVLMDAASLREGLDYVEEIPDSSSETSDDNEDMEEDDATESERNEDTDSEEE